MTETRTSGLILHPTALPSRGGIGNLGASARSFVDFLATAEQQLWQVLPLGPTGHGNSPYMATSAFAGNPLLIDLDPLVERGWLSAGARDDRLPVDGPFVDFEAVSGHRRRALAAAWRGFQDAASPADRDALTGFRERTSWLADFALFSALLDRHHGALWSTWPGGVRDRDPEALAAARAELGDAIGRIEFEQWVFAEQWAALKTYANERGVQLIGDIPIFVSHNSADVWANRELFHLDAEGNATVVAGVPPDYFAKDGQRWGNPLYRWDVLAERGFDWWIARFAAALETVDWVRVDHFRGFVAYWEIPATADTAREGRWVDGPGRAVFDAVSGALGDLPIIAEDLGIVDESVETLRADLGLPGMKVLHFAFLDGDSHNLHLPHNHTPDCVAYTGTHDNDTSVGFWEAADTAVHDYARSYLGIDGNDIAWQLMGAAWQSSASMAIAPVQDVLVLGTECRFNTPGEADGNWAWRLAPGELHGGHATGLRQLTRRYGRSRVTNHWRD